MKDGSGLEHHEPHWYSQVGVAEMAVVEVQSEAVDFVVVVDVVEEENFVELVVDLVDDAVELVLVLDEVVHDVDVLLEILVLEVDQGVLEVVGLEDVVVHVDEVENDELEVVVEVEDVLEDTSVPLIHCSVLSRSFAKYRLIRAGPPQISSAFPVQGIAHSVLLTILVPFPRTTPQ